MKFKKGMATLFLATGVLSAHAVQNPVTWFFPAADSGAGYYNGDYYLTRGQDVRVSDNLLQWGPAIKVIAKEQHTWITNLALSGTAAVVDVDYVNGVFHYYYQIKDLATDKNSLGHSTSTSPLGPYVQPVDAPFLASSIDAEFFHDDDGLNYFYCVTFGGGNFIPGKALPDTSYLNGAPPVLLSALPGTWEKRDHNINEGPFVIKWRGRYYMTYAANHTDSDYGNYAIGCAESATPLGFSNAGKYTDPVVDWATQPGGSGWISNCGQPWVVDGPNGFEQWMGYFALYTANGYGTRRQGVDRIYFHNRKLYVDGPTGFHTEGYHPDPRMPGFRDLFKETDGPLDHRKWQIPSGGTWAMVGKEARQQDSGTVASVLADCAPAIHYLFEANVRVDSAGRAGVVAFHAGDDNWVKVGLDRATGKWYFRKRVAGIESESSFNLSAGFNFDGYHRLRVFKNSGDFRVRIDGEVPSGGATPFTTAFDGAGVPGLCVDGATAAFDGVFRTIGWDEWDAQIAGWGAANSGAASSGSWSTGTFGLAVSDGTGVNRIFKGEPMENYEFACQVAPQAAVPSDGQPHRLGIYAAYQDENNFVRADLNPTNRELIVGGVSQGVALPSQVLKRPLRNPLPTSEESARTWRYTTSTPSAGWEGVGFNDAAWSSGPGGFGNPATPGSVVGTGWYGSNIWLRQSFVLDESPTPFTMLRVFHDENTEIHINGILASTLPRRETPNYTTMYDSFAINAAARQSLHPGTNTIAVHCANTNGNQFIDVGIINPKVPETEDSWNLRAVKDAYRILLFVDGQELASVVWTNGAAQVGLVAENMPARYNDILAFAFDAEPASASAILYFNAGDASSAETVAGADGDTNNTLREWKSLYNSNDDDDTNANDDNSWDLDASVGYNPAPATDYRGIAGSYVFNGSGGGQADNMSNSNGDGANMDATFEIWAKPSDLVGKEVLFEDGAATRGVSLALDGSLLKFRVDDQVDGANLDATVSVNVAVLMRTNGFNQIAGRIDFVDDPGEASGKDAVLSLFLNGQKIGTTTFQGADEWSGTDGAGIGVINGGFTGPTGFGGFQGEIAILRLYSKALTDQEMRDTYLSTIGPPSFIADPLVGSYAKVGSAYGGTLADKASDPNHQTLIFSKVSGPDWLAVSPDGVFSGTPGKTDLGMNRFQVSVVDADGLGDEVTLQVDVLNTIGQSPFFFADFEGSIDGSADAVQLDAGTPVGQWTVSSQEESFTTNNAGGGVVAFGTGKYTNVASMAVAPDLADGVVVSFDVRPKGSVESGVLQNSIILRNTGNVNFVSLQYNASQPGSEATLRVYVAESGWVTLTNAVLSLPEGDLSSGVLDTIRIELAATGYRVFANEADVSGHLAYNTPANATALGSIFLVGLHNGSSLWYDNFLVAVPKLNKTHLLAEFGVPDSGGPGTLTNAAQLDTGTTVGTWTVADAQESYISGTAAGFDQGPYSFTAQMDSGAPVADGAVFTVDMRSRRDGSGKYNGIRLKNENGANSVSLRWSGTADGVSGKLDYWTGSWMFLTNGIFLPNRAAAFTEGLDTDRLVVRMDPAGYDVEVNGVVLLTGASYQNIPSTIDSVQFFGDGGTNSLAGAWYDTVMVQSAVQAGWEPVGYAAWSDGWGVNIGAEPADADHDGLSNLYEYGLGGDPTNPAIWGLPPEFGLWEAEGSNWLAYIHPQRSDPASGLAYHLELGTNLLSGIWTNDGYMVLGTNVTGEAFDYVTNVTSTVEDGKYVRLIIE